MAAPITNSFTLPGLLAGEDLSSSQYYFVKYAATSGEVVAINGTTDTVAGILQNAPADEEVAEVMCAGVSKLIAGSTAISVGAKVGWNAEGQGMSKSTATSRYGGIAHAAAAADGDEIVIHLIGHGLI